MNPNSRVENNFRLPGQYYDAETGFHYNWHRYYSPAIGRYLRSDPIGLNGGLNLFLYAENSANNLTDSSGLIAGVDDAAIIVGGGLFIVTAYAILPQDSREQMGRDILSLLDMLSHQLSAPELQIGIDTHSTLPNTMSIDDSKDYGDKKNWPWWQENIGPTECEGEPSDDDRCRQVKNKCISECSESSLPTSDYGVSFWKCVNECMERNGCL